MNCELLSSGESLYLVGVKVYADYLKADVCFVESRLPKDSILLLTEKDSQTEYKVELPGELSLLLRRSVKYEITFRRKT